MISPVHDPEILHGEFAAGDPFPHLVLDGFLDDAIADQLAGELESCDTSSWWSDEHDHQQLKRTMSDLERVPPTVAEVLRSFNSPEVCAYFSRLTGIEELEGDVAFVGGGVHVSLPGGRLDVHADFNLHPATGMHRRLNALLYLNREWEPDWNGQLELWSDALDHPVQVIEPVMNRLVVFRIRDDAFHGVRSPITCPEGVQRSSLALYYYTADRPEEEKAPFHWASWQEPHGDTPAGQPLNGT